MTNRSRACALALGGIFLAGVLTPCPARDLRFYSPSFLLGTGETEVKLFNNLYTQTEFFDDSGDRVDQGNRSTWFTGTAAVRWGWRPRVNPGLELAVRSVKDERFPDGSESRTGLTAITPRVQVAPMTSRPELSVQTGLRIPVGSDLEGSSSEPFLDFEDPAWVTQILYDHVAAASVRLYLETGAFVRLAGDDSQLTTPTKLILNWEPSAWTLYVPLEVAPDWLGDSAGNYYSQIGLGAKARPTPSMEVEALYTLFPLGKSSGAGQTFNLGLRIVR